MTNLIASALQIDEQADWIGVRIDGNLAAVIEHIPARNGYFETLYAKAGRGFTPNNPGFAVFPGATPEEIRRAFENRFIRRKGEPIPAYALETERQDRTEFPFGSVIQSKLEREFREKIKK